MFKAQLVRGVSPRSAYSFEHSGSGVAYHYAGQSRQSVRPYMNEQTNESGYGDIEAGARYPQGQPSEPHSECG